MHNFCRNENFSLQKFKSQIQILNNCLLVLYDEQSLESQTMVQRESENIFQHFSTANC